MIRMIRYLQREIRCSGESLPRLISHPDCPRDLPLLRRLSCEEPFDLSDAYRNAKEKSQVEMFFSGNDWQLCDDLFESLGRGDLAEQDRRLTLGESAFLQAEQMISEKIRTTGRPAVVLGCSFGAVFVLLFL